MTGSTEDDDGSEIENLVNTGFDNDQGNAADDAATSDDLFEQLKANPEFSRLLDDLTFSSVEKTNVSDAISKLKNYADEGASEIGVSKVMRILSSLVALVLLIVVVCLLVTHVEWLRANPDTKLAWEVSAALIVTCIGTAAALVLTVTRAAFRSFAERNDTVMVPEHIKPLVEQLTKILGKND